MNNVEKHKKFIARFFMRAKLPNRKNIFTISLVDKKTGERLPMGERVFPDISLMQAREIRTKLMGSSEECGFIKKGVYNIVFQCSFPGGMKGRIDTPY